MKERLTQVLLAAVVVLLVAQLFRGTSLPVARADGIEKIPDVLRGRSLEIVDDQGRAEQASSYIQPIPKSPYRTESLKLKRRSCDWWIKTGAHPSNSSPRLMGEDCSSEANRIRRMLASCPTSG